MDDGRGMSVQCPRRFDVLRRIIAISIIGLMRTGSSSAQCAPKAVIDSAFQLGEQRVLLEVFLSRDFRRMPEGTAVGFTLRAFSGSRTVPIRQGWELKRGWITNKDSTWALLPRSDTWWASDSSFFDVKADTRARPPTGSNVRVMVELETDSITVQCLDLGRWPIIRTD